MMKLTKFLGILVLIISVFLISGCVQPKNSTATPGLPSVAPETYNDEDNNTGETTAEKFEESPFGIAISHFGSDYLTRMPEDLLGAGSHWAGSLIVRWYEIEPIKGEFNWEKIDYYLGEVGNEINLLLELRLCNDWASVGGCEKNLAGSPLKEEHWDDLDNFLKLLVRREGNKVKYWSIGNEMEIENFWCCTFCKTEEESAEEYLKILKRAYNVIKEADDDAVIVLGGFTGNWKNGTNVNPEFVEYVLKNGKDYFDILDVHLYGDPETYEERIQWFIELMSKYGYSKPIWSTEMGGPDIRSCLESNMSGSRDKSLEEIITENECARVFHLPGYRKEYYKMHAEEVVKRYMYAFDAEVSKPFWWTLYAVKEYQHLTYEWMSHVVFSKMGLVATESERGKGVINYMKTPGYYTYKIMAEELDMFDSIEKLSLNDAEVFLFNVLGKSVIVAWSEKGAILDLSNYFDGTAKIRHIVSELDEQENPVYLEDEFFSSAAVKIGQEPVFIKEVSG